MVFTRKNIVFPLPPIILSDIPLPYNYSFKFLGLYIDFKLSWNTHLKRIRSKLSSACGLLFRIRNKITRTVAKLIYNSICLPYLQYCNILWTSCANSKLQFIFTCQKRIIRNILRKDRWQPSAPLFKKLNILNLFDLNNLNAALFVFKSLNGLISSPITFIQQIPGPYNLRRNEALHIPFTRTNQSQRFISIRGAKLWNSLPLDVRASRTTLQCKRKLKRLFLDQYT